MIPPMLAINIPGRPVAWARAGSQNGRRYTPAPQTAYMAVVATLARAAMSRAGYQPFTGPVELSYRATYAYPKSWSEKRRAKRVFKTSAPDASNLVKLVEDAMQGICFHDDAQVQIGCANKVYGVPEGVVITLTSLASADDEHETKRESVG